MNINFLINTMKAHNLVKLSSYHAMPEKRVIKSPKSVFREEILHSQDPFHLLLGLYSPPAPPLQSLKTTPSAFKSFLLSALEPHTKQGQKLSVILVNQLASYKTIF